MWLCRHLLHDLDESIVVVRTASGRIWYFVGEDNLVAERCSFHSRSFLAECSSRASFTYAATLAGKQSRRNVP